MSTRQLKYLGIAILLLIAQTQILLAEGSVKTVTRGEAVMKVIEHFDLKNKKENYLHSCKKNIQDCLLDFSTRSNFKSLRLKSLALYPDVKPRQKFYNAIIDATMLDLVRGYWQEKNSPFKPQQEMTRAEALKLVLGAADIMNWKEKFEVENSQDSYLGLAIKNVVGLDMTGVDGWWQARYFGFAYQANLLVKGGLSGSEPITQQELNDLLSKTDEYLQNRTQAWAQKAYSSGSPS